MTTLPRFEDHRRPIRRKIRSIRSVNDDDSSVAILVGGSAQSVMSCQPVGPAQPRSMPRAPRSRSPGSREFVQFRFFVGIDRGIQFRIELSHARRHAHIVRAQVRASCGSIRTLFRSPEQVRGVPVYHRQSSNDLKSPILFHRSLRRPARRQLCGCLRRRPGRKFAGFRQQTWSRIRRVSLSPWKGRFFDFARARGLSEHLRGQILAVHHRQGSHQSERNDCLPFHASDNELQDIARFGRKPQDADRRAETDVPSGRTSGGR